MAYLIGVNEKHFINDYDPPEYQIYEALEKNDNAKIIRELCRLRTAIERNFSNINSTMQREFRTIMTMSEYVPLEAITYLAEKGIQLIKKSNRQTVDYICDINRFILDRINNIRD